MSPDLTGEVREWVEWADEDVRAAAVDLKADPPLLRDAAFHCQQAVEKVLKAFLTARETPFRKTHDIDELARPCEAADPTLAPLLDKARDLSPFAWRTRYPGDAIILTPEDAAVYLDLARTVVDTVRRKLPGSQDGGSNSPHQDTPDPSNASGG
jgi:HEPN domain-containing protein